MIVHIVDGTYELFRQFFARPSHVNAAGEEVAAARAVTRGMLRLLTDGATHVGIATDHVITSFRNDLYPGYKTGEGLDETITAQFHPLEEALAAAGFATFPMVDYEADDAMASMAAVAAQNADVSKVFLRTADKDLAQCVEGNRVVQLDQRNNRMLNAGGVQDKFGVPPASIPDYLALVGDSADGFPGLKGWGAKTTATVLRRYGTIENIPTAAGKWDITVRGSSRLATTLSDHMDDALLFKRLATLDRSAPTITDVDQLRWLGPTSKLAAWADRFDAPDLVATAEKLATVRER